MPFRTPVRAAVGLAATLLDEARTFPERAIELPMLAVSTALQLSLRAQQHYAQLAARGEEVLHRAPTTAAPPSWATFDEPPAGAVVVDVPRGRRGGEGEAHDEVELADFADPTSTRAAAGPVEEEAAAPSRASRNGRRTARPAADHVTKTADPTKTTDSAGRAEAGGNGADPTDPATRRTRRRSRFDEIPDDDAGNDDAASDGAVNSDAGNDGPRDETANED